MRKVIFVLFVCGIVISCSKSNVEQIEMAATCFENLKKVSDSDNGKLWGKTLYGPTMFVNLQSRNLIANQQNKDNSLEQRGKLFFGQLPDDLVIANTAKLLR